MGVRQVYVFSLELFNLYNEAILRELGAIYYYVDVILTVYDKQTALCLWLIRKQSKESYITS